MTDAAILRQLEELAEGLAVQVIYTNLDHDVIVVRSGTCTLRGQILAIIDERLSLHARILALADCLAQFDLSTIYLVPIIRELIEARRPLPRAS